MDPSKHGHVPEINLKCVCPHPNFIKGTQPLRMVQCVTPNCKIVEHFHCVYPTGILSWPIENHRCTKCRMAFADPFWHTVKPQEIIPPTIIHQIPHPPQQYPPAPVVETFKGIEKHFNLTQADMANLRAKRQKIQVVCLQLGDEIQFRYHWPKQCSLKINNRSYRVYGRHAENSITKGQRDEPAPISTMVEAGRNKIQLCCYDNQAYVFCVQIVAETAKEVVYGMLHSPENLDASVMRIRRIVRSQISCGVDDEIKAMTSVMSLKCPFSSTRIKVPGRLLNIDSLECVFDLNAFLTMVEKTRKWACPHTLKPSSIHHLAKDVWLEAILKSLQNFPEITEIEVSNQAAWRIRGESKWRSIYNTTPIDHLSPSLLKIKKESEKSAHINDEESDDEAMEMKKAALAAKEEIQRYSRIHRTTQNIEVIDLVSSGDEEEGTQTIVIQPQSLTHPPPPPTAPNEIRGAQFRPLTTQIMRPLSRGREKHIYGVMENPNGVGMDLARQCGYINVPVAPRQQGYTSICDYTQVAPIILQPAYPVTNTTTSIVQNNTLDLSAHPKLSDIQRKRDKTMVHVQHRRPRKKTRNSKHHSSTLCSGIECIDLDQTDSN
eukprot:g679.t1